VLVNTYMCDISKALHIRLMKDFGGRVERVGYACCPAFTVLVNIYMCNTYKALYTRLSRGNLVGRVEINIPCMLCWCHCACQCIQG